MMQILLTLLVLGFTVESQHIGNSSILSNLQSENDGEDHIASENVKDKLTSVTEKITTNLPVQQDITVLPSTKEATSTSSSDKNEAPLSSHNEIEKKSGSVPRKGVEDGPLPSMAPDDTEYKLGTTNSAPTLKVESGEDEETGEDATQETSVENGDEEADGSSQEGENSKEDDDNNSSNEDLPTMKLHPKKVENGTVSSVLSPKTPLMKPKTATSDSEALSTSSALIASILIVIVLCCFAGIAYFKLVKRGISRRHYERVDFLIEGMYDDDL